MADYYRNDIKWGDGQVVHSCEGDRIVPFDPDTFLVWTKCGRDVPAGRGFTGGPDANCPDCAASPTNEGREP